MTIDLDERVLGQRGVPVKQSPTGTKTLYLLLGLIGNPFPKTEWPWARARAQGKRISRAPLAGAVQQRIAALYHQGLSIHHIAKHLGIGYGTAWNYVQRVKTEERGGVLKTPQ
jgi:hypothetical protein